MFSDQLTLFYGSEPWLLNRINQDKYSSEYLSRSTDHEVRLNIRHKTFNASDRGGITCDRHNVELTYSQFPSDTVPSRKDLKMYFVLEVERREPPVDPGNFAQALLQAFCGENVDIETQSLETGSGIGKLLQLES